VPRILIIDHDVEATSSLASLLRAAGYDDFRVAYPGKTALAVAAEYLPTLLFVEVDPPDMSGCEVARLLSQHPSLENLRMIALTGSSDHPGRELARVAGFERYLIKPVAAAALDELMSMQ